MGYDVTAVDIEQRFVDLIEHRCRSLQTPPKTICGDFFNDQALSKTYNAVLFYECFHHCSDHIRLLKLLRNTVSPEGIIVFASEPIIESFPMPWGLRLDGESLWAVRQCGWLELGFKESYFRDAMCRTGWIVEKFEYPVTHLGRIFVGRRTQ